MTTSKTQDSAQRRAGKVFARTPREAYLLAAQITEAGEYFGKRVRLLRDCIRTTSGGVRAGFEEELERLVETRKWFEAQLLENPASAVAGLERVRNGFLDIRGARVGRLLDAPASAAVRNAVIHVAEWIARTSRGEHRGFSMPVATLGPIASVRSVQSEDDIKRLLKTGPVQKALRGDEARKRGGPKDAAIALVALATGIGEQTVKRAARGIK